MKALDDTCTASLIMKLDMGQI